MEQNRESTTVPSMYENTIHTKKALHISEERYTNQWASLVAQMVKNLPAIWETQVRSLGQEDLLEEGMATHSSILAWRIPWTEEPVRLQSVGSQSQT